MRRVRRLLLLLVGVATAVLALAAPALAHATVTASSPADGADLAVAPARVSITFDEPVGLQPGYLQVIDGSGRRVDVGSATHPGGDAATVAVDLAPGLDSPAGYVASYRVVSADSHPVSGVVRFTVRGGTPVRGIPTEPTTSRLVSALLDAVTTASYAGLALAGGAWLLISLAAGVLDSRRARRVVRGGLGIAVAATVGQLALQGPYTAGTGLADVGNGSLWADTLRASAGTWRLLTVAALVALLALSVPIGRWHTALPTGRRTVVAVAAALWVAALVGVAAAGHAGVQTPVWLVLPSTVAHLLAMTAWTGGLVVLVVVVVPVASTGSDGPTPAAEQQLLRRVSGVALGSVATLAVTGTYQAWIETRSWSALLGTTYGALVLTKVGLFAVLVGLGAVARRHVRRRHGPRTLRAGVCVELGVIATVLAVTSVLVTEAPARQAHATQVATRPASATATFDRSRSAQVQIDPAHHGPVTVTVTLVAVASARSLTLTATQPARHIGPLPVTLTPRPTMPGEYHASRLDLPVSGAWTFELTLRTSEFDSVVADVTITID